MIGVDLDTLQHGADDPGRRGVGSHRQTQDDVLHHTQARGMGHTSQGRGQASSTMLGPCMLLLLLLLRKGSRSWRPRATDRRRRAEVAA